MRHTLSIMLAVLLSAGAVVYALLVVANDVRHVSDELEVVNHDMSGMADDVRSLADDVNAIADALAGDDDDDDTREAPAAVSQSGDPSARGRSAPVHRHRLHLSRAATRAQLVAGAPR